jgi:hypothetical protein
MAIVINTIVATDGTGRREVGRNTQSYIARITAPDSADGNAIILPHDLGFDPTWVQIQAVSPNFGAPTGTLLPAVNVAGDALVYNHVPRGIYCRVQATTPGTTPVIDVLVHCGSTHSTPL